MNKTAIINTLRNIININPSTLTHKTKSITGTKTAIGNDLIYSDFGQLNKYKFSILTIADDFTVAPACDDTITIGALTYRVIGIGIDSMSVGLRLDLGEY